ncbi:glycosyltransferase family 9 protein [Catellatospora sp. KI3]|uniref:glycosyltransferase family 9 protein n=1 Tax=Catellatospora sp. KI3 TaxID=3041620 RepID=UPI0024830AB3|nr:glycosyltransferase family 9 protein [Catellatospora sp. KI3]MDI1460691.1 glycosyltransferase family 9 protein [Catellatospora sp. KI3]
MSRSRRILVLRALGIGDLAAAVPALRALRTARPDARITLAAPDWLAPLAGLTGAVDRVEAVDGLAASVVGGGPYDLAVNLHGRGPRSHLLLRRSTSAGLWAFRCPAAEHGTGPDWRAAEHEVARWCRLLRWYGGTPDPQDLALRRPRLAVPTGLTLVHPGAKTADRRWPAARFAEVCAALHRSGHRVALTGSAAERDLGLDIAARAGLGEDRVLAGRTGVAELAALVAAARLVVSGDTGIAHLATAYAVPSVVMFGALGPHLWGPPAGRPWHQALWHPDPAALPRPASGPHPALLATTCTQVIEAAELACAAAPAGAGPAVPAAPAAA